MSKDAFTAVATREATPREVIRKRLLLVLYALGTNVGIKRVADGGRQGETEAALRATRHLFVNRDNLHAAIATLVNATLRMRDPLWWGNGPACASEEVRVVVVEPDDRVPRPVWRPWRHDLLARGPQIGVRLLPASIL